MFKPLLIVLSLTIIVAVGIFILANLTKPIDQQAVMFSEADAQIAGKNLILLLANEPAEYQQGLSGLAREDLLVDGMWFVFSTAEEREFWMPDMKFNLDVMWMQGGMIVKIDENVPAPLEGEEPVHMTSSPHKVDMVIELPAGRVDELGFKLGDRMLFKD